MSKSLIGANNEGLTKKVPMTFLSHPFCAFLREDAAGSTEPACTVVPERG
jgi:hypothetical protein